MPAIQGFIHCLMLGIILYKIEGRRPGKCIESIVNYSSSQI